MNVICSACKKPYVAELEGATMQGVHNVRYCPPCRKIAAATWVTRSAARSLLAAGLVRESEAVASVAQRVALPGAYTRSQVLSGTVKRVRV
jgi:hypothetical protein